MYSSKPPPKMVDPKYLYTFLIRKCREYIGISQDLEGMFDIRTCIALRYLNSTFFVAEKGYEYYIVAWEFAREVGSRIYSTWWKR